MRDRANEVRIRINDGITVPQVRLIDEKGEQLGIKPIAFAQEYAASHNLDLVEVAAQSDPPVCRIMNYSKYRYELELKAKQARKHQSQIVIKEIKFRPKVGVHDYETKKGHVLRFLQHKDKVKVTIMFRGREMVHPERGETAALAARRRCQGVRRHRVQAAARRAQHGHDAGAGEVAGGGAYAEDKDPQRVQEALSSHGHGQAGPPPRDEEPPPGAQEFQAQAGLPQGVRRQQG